MDSIVPEIVQLKDDYLADIQADLDKQPEKPHKKTKAEKRAARKLKKKLRDIENRKLVMRDALTRELEMSKRTERTHIKEWEEMCGKIQVTEIKKQLIGWSEKVKATLDSKNYKLDLLLEDLDNTNQMQAKMFGKTAEILDYFGRTFVELVNVSKNLYELQAEEILKDFYEYMKRTTENLGFTQSQNITLAHNANVVNTLKEDFELSLLKREDCINTNIENRFQIRDEVVKKMKELHNQLNAFVASLTNTALDAHKYERIRWLTERQSAFVDESKKLMVEEMKCRSTIADLQNELLNVESKRDSTINDLRLEYEYFINVRKSIEKEIKMDRDITHDKLKILSNEAYEVKKDYERFIKTGENALTLSISCRKLQTKAEKIVLGGETPALKVDLDEINENFKIETLDLKECIDMTEEEILEYNKFFKNFAKRQAMVQAQNMLLKAEITKLTEENGKYLKFIQSMSKTDDENQLVESLDVQRCSDQLVKVTETCINFDFKHK